MRIMPSGYVMSNFDATSVRRHVPSNRWSGNNVLETACLRGSQSSAHTHSRYIEDQESRVYYLGIDNHLRKFLATATRLWYEGCTAMRHSNQVPTSVTEMLK